MKFGKDVEEVQKWPIKKVVEHATFLMAYYGGEKLPDIHMPKMPGVKIPGANMGLGSRSRVSDHMYQFR